MRRKIETIIQTCAAVVMLAGIWRMLEILFYGEIQPRIVDDIMILFLHLSSTWLVEIKIIRTTFSRQTKFKSYVR